MKKITESEKVIKETLALYEDGGKCPDTLRGTTIIHLYTQEDTFDEEGQLNGYYQNLFFNLVVFNDYEGVRKSHQVGKRDAIFTHGCNIENLSVFKDGAFCVKLEGTHKFLDGQDVTFYKD